MQRDLRIMRGRGRVAKTKANTHDAMLQVWARFFRRETECAGAADDPPLRSELFNRDQMNRHAKALTETHQLHSVCHSLSLLARPVGQRTLRHRSGL